jgi:hypothetical protein
MYSCIQNKNRKDFKDILAQLNPILYISISINKWRMNILVIYVKFPFPLLFNFW